ncbi:MAG TPA: Xaa-Pro peptidase family protein [Planctomycetota bacterium]
MLSFPPEEFAARRRRVRAAIGRDARALVRGAGPVRSFDVFRQTNEFHYLCGVETPGAALLIGDVTTLYLPRRDEKTARSDGDVLHADAPDEARRATGVDEVRPIDTLAPTGPLYVPRMPPEGRYQSRDVLLRVPGEDPDQAFYESLKGELRDLSPILDDLRLIKSPRELAVLRQAGRLSALGVVEAMRCTRPGVREAELVAVAEYVHRVNGSAGEGYAPIAPSGPRVWHPHWFRNDGVLAAGDWVLLDCAPDLGYYTSDIGRLWPVSGRFSPLQRQLYGFMTAWHRALLRRIKPGLLPAAVLAEAAAEMEDVIALTRFESPAHEAGARATLKYRGHLSHPVGMAVHDVGDYWKRPFAPGLVFAVDPQMWIPEEKIYVRVEDTVAVTETGVEILTAAAPLDAEAVEKAVGGGGLLQAFPPLEVR